MTTPQDDAFRETQINEPDIDQLADTFDAAWMSGQIPEICEFLPQPNPPWNEESVRDALVELIAIDMEYEDGSGFNRFRYDILTAGPQIGVGFSF